VRVVKTDQLLDAKAGVIDAFMGRSDQIVIFSIVERHHHPARERFGQLLHEHGSKANRMLSLIEVE